MDAGLSVSMVANFLIIAGLVFVNGFFVAAEFALVKVRSTRLAEMEARGSRTAAQARRMVGRLDSYLAATQLGITIASLGLGWIGEPAVASLLEAPLHGPGVRTKGIAQDVCTEAKMRHGDLPFSVGG